ncbi:hypothetical protein Tco_1556879 [Tanacetum coccineum]
MQILRTTDHPPIILCSRSHITLSSIYMVSIRLLRLTSLPFKLNLASNPTSSLPFSSPPITTCQKEATKPKGKSLLAFPVRDASFLVYIGPISSASSSSLLDRDTFIDFFSFFVGLQVTYFFFFFSLVLKDTDVSYSLSSIRDLRPPHHSTHQSPFFPLRKEATKPKGKSLLAFPVRDASFLVYIGPISSASSSSKEATKPKGRSLLAFPVRDASFLVYIGPISSASASSLLSPDIFIDFFSFFQGLHDTDVSYSLSSIRDLRPPHHSTHQSPFFPLRKEATKPKWKSLLAFPVRDASFLVYIGPISSTSSSSKEATKPKGKSLLAFPVRDASFLVYIGPIISSLFFMSLSTHSSILHSSSLPNTYFFYLSLSLISSLRPTLISSHLRPAVVSLLSSLSLLFDV